MPPKNTLPARVANRRITVQIHEFYRNMATFFEARDWPFTQARETGDIAFEHPHFLVSAPTRYADGAARVLRLALRDVPGVSRVSRTGHPDVTWTHTLEAELPRSYPLSLHLVRVAARTPVVNPRLSRGKACFTVRGDVDRILCDLVFHVLLEPSRIRPPKLFPGNDHGIDAQAMKWYQKTKDRPARIHEWLLRQWVDRIGT